MKLITPELEENIPKLYAQDGKGMYSIAYVKFFTPDSNWTWFVTEYDPAQRLCFGFVCGFVNEFGYFSLDELESVRGPLGLPVERDLHFIPKMLLELKTY